LWYPFFGDSYRVATIRLLAEVSNLAVIRQFVAQAAHGTGLDEKAISDLQLAVDEICANVIQHGYSEQGGELEVTIEAIEGGVEATVRDWGRAFDPQAIPIPDVTAPLEGRRLGGLGLYLVRKVMDHVHFAFDEKNGNVVTMIKRIQPKEGNP
jgi:serine/threonine-protein kinase RsbW